MEPQIIGIIEAIKTAFSHFRKNRPLGYIVKISLLSLLIIIAAGLAVSVLMLISSFSLYNFDSVPAWFGYQTALLPRSLSIFANSLRPTKVLGDMVNATSQYVTAAPTNTTSGLSVIMVGLTVVFYALIIIIGAFIGALELQAVVDIGSGNLRRLRPLVKIACSKTLPLLGLSIVTSLIVMLGFILLIVPGIIFSLMFMMAPFFMFEEDLGIIEALKRSKELTNGYKLQLFTRLFLLCVLNVIAFIPLTFLLYTGGQIMITIYSAFLALVSYTYYKNIQNIKTPQPTF